MDGKNERAGGRTRGGRKRMTGTNEREKEDVRNKRMGEGGTGGRNDEVEFRIMSTSGERVLDRIDQW